MPTAKKHKYVVPVEIVVEAENAEDVRAVRAAMLRGGVAPGYVFNRFSLISGYEVKVKRVKFKGVRRAN